MPARPYINNKLASDAYVMYYDLRRAGVPRVDAQDRVCDFVMARCRAKRGTVLNLLAGRGYGAALAGLPRLKKTGAGNEHGYTCPECGDELQEVTAGTNYGFVDLRYTCRRAIGEQLHERVSPGRGGVMHYFAPGAAHTAMVMWTAYELERKQKSVGPLGYQRGNWIDPLDVQP